MLETSNKEKKLKAIIVEDQPIIWDYAASCLRPFYEVISFCTNTSEAEEAMKKLEPDFVWLDCYLGEISESSQGIKNSGLLIAEWIKNHFPYTKIFLFTASTEFSILQTAQKLNLEGIALGGKYIKSRELIIEAVRDIYAGKKWLSPNIIEEMELDKFKNITIFEFCVVSSLMLGKSTHKIADELDTSRKLINNAIYRVRQKFFVDPEMTREDFVEHCKDLFKESFEPSSYYNLTELTTINALIDNCLSPILTKLKNDELMKRKLLRPF